MMISLHLHKIKKKDQAGLKWPSTVLPPAPQQSSHSSVLAIKKKILKKETV
jgi:hypothetical protein